MPQVRIPRTLVDYAAAIKAPRCVVSVDDYEGTAYTFGSAEAAVNGFSKDDVRAAWRILRKAGFDLPGRLHKRSGEVLRDEVSERSYRTAEDILAQALMAQEERIPWQSVAVFSRTNLFADRKAQQRAKRARRVERLREAGLCIVCGRHETQGDASTCTPCGRARNARKRKR